MVKHLQDGACTRIILRPNRSASWRQTRVLIAVLGGFSLCVAIVWALLGAWMVLPFAGLEVLILATVMHRVCRATYREEAIVFEGESTYLYKNNLNHTNSSSSNNIVINPRKEASISVRQLEDRSDECQIFLKYRNREVELGSFLNHDEKRELIKVLKAYFLLRHITSKHAYINV